MKYTLTMSALVALGAAQKFHLERRVSSAPQVNGYAASASIDGSALAVPVDCTGYDTFMGSLYFSGDPFDPSLCAEACTAQSQLNQIFPPADGPVQTCQFFNTYQLLRNGLLEWQVCSMVSP
jgi:hypothetical protein